MSDMKCPFCQQELDTSKYYIRCHNPHCNTTTEMEGTEEMWNALSLTYKALRIAVDALKRIKEPAAWGSLYQEQEIATDALEQIKALEQKSN